MVASKNHAYAAPRFPRDPRGTHRPANLALRSRVGSRRQLRSDSGGNVASRLYASPV
jgi:hypothetical protein